MIHQLIFTILFIGTFIFTNAQKDEKCEIKNVCFALDQSGSVRKFYQDIRDFTIRTALQIDGRTQNTVYSAYGFSTRAVTIQSPTEDLKGSFIPAVRTQQPALQGTNIRVGLQACLDALKSATGTSVTILLTDGQGAVDPLPLKPEFINNKISLVTIGVGSGVNENDLKQLATSEELYLKFDNSEELLDRIATVTDKACNPTTGDSCEEAYKQCDFQFFGRDAVPEYTIGKKPDTVFTNRIVSKTNSNVGVLNTNGIDVEFLTGDASSAITGFGSPRLTPTHFKPLSFTNRLFATGIGHQTFTGDQLSVSRNRCVRISFSNFQVISSTPFPHVVDNVNGAKKNDNKCVVFRTA